MKIIVDNMRNAYYILNRTYYICKEYYRFNIYETGDSHMSKFKISYKNNQIFIKSRLERTEKVNEQELEMFHKKMIRGLIRPKMDGKKKLSYQAPCGSTLQSYLQRGISRDDFFLILAQIIEITKKTKQYGFRMENLLLELRYTFINESTRELYLIYQPIFSSNFWNSIFSYLHEIAYNSTIQMQENTNFIDHFTDFLCRMSVYSEEEMERYIMRVNPKVYQYLRRDEPGQSQALRYKRWMEQRKNSFFQEESEGVYEKDMTSRKEEGTTLLEEEGTTLLEEKETTLLREKQLLGTYLIRSSNNDKIFINKSVFRIGKERSSVDYFVSNNNAVSRVHADIIRRGASYYLKDDHSTNHTFVNGVLIGEDEETEIFDGDELTLANEVFEFHINREHL